MINMFKIIKTVKYFNTYLSVTHGTPPPKKKEIKNTKDLNNTMNKLNFTNLLVYRILNPTTMTT